MGDAHILTVDSEKFVSDPRISVIHHGQDSKDTWTLQIKYVRSSVTTWGSFRLKDSTM